MFNNNYRIMSFFFIQNKTSNLHDYKKIQETFVNEYYSIMSSGSPSKVLHMFRNDVKCSFNDEEFVGEYNVIVRYAEHGITRIMYRSLSSSCQFLNDGKYILNVSGECAGILYTGLMTSFKHFSETFIIEKFGDVYLVVSHMFRAY